MSGLENPGTASPHGSYSTTSHELLLLSNKMKLLDCTLRDGGYYTNWDFDDSVVCSYIRAMNALPVDYLELGYRSTPSGEYLGKFGYTPVSVLKGIRRQCSKKLAVMLNEKDTRPEHLPELIGPIVGLADMIRIALDPGNFDRALALARAVKGMGFEVGFNTMYMSKWHDYEGFLDKLDLLDGVADVFCMVDSFGGATPEDIKDTFAAVRGRTACPIGFHGHNNLQMGLANTLAAIRCGADFVDATVLGMGRGAGNLNTELLLTCLAKRGLDVDFNVLGEAVETFKALYEEHRWGTILPYMISGAYSIPQKEVMAWVGNRAYSFNSIVRALDNRRNRVADNARYPVLNAEKARQVLIVGGGESVREHISAISEFLQNNTEMRIIFATARHARLFTGLANGKAYCLVGNEARRLKSLVSAAEFKGICVLPPYPRTMGTEVPGYAEDKTFELRGITFTESFLDSCTTAALECAVEYGADEVYVVGYDGYRGAVLSEKEADLTNENRALFDDFKARTGKEIISLVPTLYKSLKVTSIYQFL